MYHVRHNEFQEKWKSVILGVFVRRLCVGVAGLGRADPGTTSWTGWREQIQKVNWALSVSWDSLLLLP